MRHNIITTTALFIGLSINVFAQCPEKYQGTARMYPFEDIVETAAPKGYKPYYISHYGRHGARYNTKHDPYDVMLDALQAGHDSSALTALGEETYQRYLKEYPGLKGHHGDLCPTGEWQQRQLADRLVKTYPGVFKGNVKVDASSSIVPRAIVSMAAFCTELQKCCPKADIHQRSYSSEILITNGFGKDNPKMNHPALMKEMVRMYGPKDEKEVKANAETYKVLLDPFFTDLSVVEGAGGLEKVSLAMMDVVLHMPESEDKMDDIFPEAIYRKKWELGNKRMGLLYNQKLEGLSLFGILTTDLMEDFIGKKDQDIEDGVSVRLRFGHDLVLISLLALMQVDDWADTLDLSNMPMASNFKMIVYKKKGAEDLVKFVFNDKECSLPIESDIAPYYKWSDVEDYCSNISSRVSSLFEK